MWKNETERPPRPKDTATLELLRKWREEDALATPEERARFAVEWEEFKKQMNETRREEGRPPAFP